MLLEILKISETTNSTLSQILIDGAFYGFVPEDGYRAVKEPGATRIPDGTYKIIPRRYGKFYTQYRKIVPFIPEVAGVPNYQDILIHPGNSVKDTRGCLCPNKMAGFDSKQQLFYGSDSTALWITIVGLIAAAFDREEEVFVTLKRDTHDNAV